MNLLPRRRFVLGAAALLSPLALPKLLLAQPVLAVPKVDGLVVRVITDSSYDTPRPSANKWVKVKRVGLASPTDFRKTLHNEWGLALALESRIGTDTRHFLLDSGYTTDALLNNIEIMGIDGAQIQALILSHGHYDHFGGLIGFLEKYRARLPSDLILYTGGEDNFCMRKILAGAPGHFSDFGALDRRDLERLKVKIAYCERPTIIQGHAFTTGSIKRRTFEKDFPGPVVQYVKQDGLGCDMPAMNEKAQGKFVFDEHVNEHATCFNLKDRGLVVISSCGHTGILNAVVQARELSGVAKVHAVLGGFHLFPADDEYLKRVVTELKSLDPDVVIPLHCSGPGFTQAMRELLGDRLLTSTTGTEFTFGA